MSEEGEGPTASDRLIGAFIILFGLCMAFVGGACAVAAGASLVHPGEVESVGLSLFAMSIAIAVAVGGLFMMRSGLRISRSGYRRSPGDEGKLDG